VDLDLVDLVAVEAAMIVFEAALVFSSVAAEAIVMTVVAEGVVAMVDAAGGVEAEAVATADFSY
jgi:hypothetical protein